MAFDINFTALLGETPYRSSNDFTYSHSKAWSDWCLSVTFLCPA